MKQQARNSASLAVKPAPSQHLSANCLRASMPPCRARGEGGCPSACPVAGRGRAPRDRLRMSDMATTPRWFWPRMRRQKPRDLAEQIANKTARGRFDASVECRRSRLHQSHLKRPVRSDALCTVLREGDRYRAKRDRRGREGQRRIRSATLLGRCMSAMCQRRSIRRCAGKSLLQFAGYDVTREYYVNEPAHRSMCSRARLPALPAKALAGHRAFRKDFIPATI